MITVNPYLNFGGNTEEAFMFYKSVFGGEFLAVMRFKDSPEGDKTPAHLQDKLMHISLPISPSCTLMGTDALEELGQKYIPGNNFSISLNIDSKAEADKIFNGLSAGGKVEVPMSDQFWGSYFGMFRDKFGIHWMVSFENKK